LNSLKGAVAESESRNEKLTKKLAYYRENMQTQISAGLQQQQERLTEL